jgi:hypothetical protein
MKFKTKILQIGDNTGIEVTETQLEQLGAGKKPLVVVTLNGYSYRCAVGKMIGKFMISLSAENRKNAGVSGGDEVEVTLEIDTAPRAVTVPTELQQALDRNESAQVAFDKLSPSRKKAIVLSITETKNEETRQRRIEKAISALVD